jgi:site-specific recombinase XerD
MDLPRHMRLTHGWKKEKARAATNLLGLRKEYSAKATKPSKIKDYHVARPCPVTGCMSVVKRMSPHLTQHHHVPPKSNTLEMYLLQARRMFREAKLKCKGDTSGSDKSDSDSSTSDASDVEPLNATVLCPAVNENVNSGNNIENSNASGMPVASLTDFHKWLQSVDGGKKRSADQHKAQIGVIVEQLGDISQLLDKNSIKTKFLDTYVVEKQFRPGTTKSYLSSLKHWYDFIQINNLVSTDDATAVASMKQTVARWIASERTDAMRRNLQKSDHDIQKLVTPQELSQLNTSQPALMAIKLLGLMSAGTRKFLAQHEFTTVRDYILTRVILGNANRSGVIANMTVQQAQNARLIDGQYVVSVDDHKTDFLYGPAKLVLDATEHSWLLIYVNIIHPKVMAFSKSSCPFVFVSWNGKQMTSGQVTHCLQSLWKKAGLREDVTCTLFRKTAVSTMHQEHPELKGNLADLMLHREATANKSYKLVQREKTSVAAAVKLRQVMNKKVVPVSSSAAIVSSEIETLDSTNLQPPISSSAAILPTEMETLDSRVNRIFQAPSSSSEIIPPSSNSGSQRVFSDSEVSTLKSCCTKIIEGGPIGRIQIEEVLNKTTEGAELLKKISMAQLISRLKYERKLFLRK